MRLKQERRSGSLKRDLEHKVEAYCWISREKNKQEAEQSLEFYFSFFVCLIVCNF